MMEDSSPVFIVGGARCGSSILYKTLQRHPSFRPKEINLEETRFFSLINKSYLFQGNKPDNLFNYMLRDQIRFKDFLDSIRSIRSLHRLTDHSLNSYLSRKSKFWWRLNLNHIVIRSYFKYAKLARSCCRIIEKTPGNLDHCTKLTCAFPECRLLYIYRHPLDVYTSYTKRSKTDKDAYWATVSPSDFCSRYRKEIAKAINMKRKNTSVFYMVKYEDFTKDPVRELRKITDFLKEPACDEAVIEENPDLNKWKIDPHLFGSIIPKTKEWSEFTSAKEAAFIEETLASTMQLLCYARYTN